MTDEKPDGLSFHPLKLQHLGSGDIGGDLEAEIARLATELADVDTFGADASAAINLKITMRRDKRAVVITTEIKTTPPKPIPKSTVAFAGPSGLVVQPAEQITIDQIRAKRAREV